MSLHAVLTMREVAARDYDEPRDAVARDWIALLNDWEIFPFPMPNGLSDPVAVLKAIAPDLVIFTGGEDPGESPIRDRTERLLLDHSLAHGVPIFAVCRGMQLIAHHFGARLTAIDGHVASRHKIQFASPWSDRCGAANEVNSYHQWAISDDELPDCLSAIAFDKTGNVEAIVHRDLPLIGVMWHPERDGGHFCDRPLISALLERWRP